MRTHGAGAASGGTVFPSSLTNNGHDTSTGWGIAAGLWWGIADNFSVGLAYQSKMSMSEFDDYSDLFAEDGGFDLGSQLVGNMDQCALARLLVREE